MKLHVMLTRSFVGRGGKEGERGTVKIFNYILVAILLF